MSSSIFFSVGEPSGDHHSARLITHLSSIDPTLRLRGFGGPTMESAGCQLDADLTQHAVVGLINVLPKLRDFFALAAQAEEVFRQGDVDAVVLVDFPGFNWYIAKRAKKYGIPVYFYCPPQLWAWGGWRIRRMRRYVDHVLSVLPIEEQYYTERGIPNTYVGHPFFDAVEESELDSQLLARLTAAREGGQQLVAVLPGSRNHEVHENWPLMLESIRQLSGRFPEAKFLIASYRDRQCLWCRDQMTQEDQSLPIEFFTNRTSEVIEAVRCAMMVSGSVSLELMARRTPATVVYRIGRFFHAVCRMVVRLDSITLPNLMSDRKIFPEMVSSGRPEPAIEFLTESMTAMLGDPFYFNQTVAQLDRLRAQYTQPGASARAAEVLCESLGIAEPPRPQLPMAA